LIYKIQEEVHRFTVSGMMRRKTHNLTSSQLTKIKGIGEKKAALLLHELKSIKAIKAASVAELAAIKGISNADASAIYNYFNSGESQL